MKNKFYTAFISLFAVISTVRAQSTDTSFYSSVSAGTVSGEQKAWRSGENEYNYTYRYNDRGRGPDQKTTIKLNPDGTIAKLNMSGVDYYKSPYQENFDVSGDSAIW